VRSSDLKTTYELGKDYQMEGRRIIRSSGSRMPTLAKADFPAGPFPWLNLAGKHVKVTYTHDDTAALPIPNYVGPQMPNTMAKLTGKKPLTVVALGDSITLGINVSGFLGTPPYQPPYADLFVRQLGKLYANPRITLHNVALGGMTSQWGKDNADSLVASLKPDLVIIAFGMNDFWSLTPDLFAANIRETIQIIRKRRPNAEFLLVSSMKFDPAYTTESPYVSNLAGYPAALKTLTGPGIQLFDMTALSQTLYDRKSQRDLATDPMHPDDFLGRWYAQGLVAMLQQPEAPATKKGIGVWNELLANDPIRAVHASWYYNWSPEPVPRTPTGVEFVPMLWGWSPGEQARNLAKLKESGAKHFLGFNEPDGTDQANITPETAIAAWPHLVKAGLPIGSPAAVHAEGPWMQTFMNGVNKANLPVDFITVHWYYLPDVDGFLGYLKKVHDLYKKPIWITEFACVDWDKKPGQPGRFTSTDVAKFVRAVLPKLDKLPWIHRYAWFSADGPYAESNLFNPDGSLTEVGKAYAGEK
jgi:lysophospholipase L1-like esterase